MNSYKISVLLLFFVVFFGCKTKKEELKKQHVEVQGHRGDRGNFPENTIPAFLSAIHKGADVIEMDVVISKDKKVVVSHEAFMSSLYVLTPDGLAIAKEKEKTYSLYEMNYDSIKKFDSGSNGNPLFPQQKKLKTYKPLLAEVIDSVEKEIEQHHFKRVMYNIEIKSEKKEYGIHQPQPEEFVDLVMNVIQQKGIKPFMNIQSFDPHLLNVLHKKYPKVKIALLTSKAGIDKNLKQLIFKPQIYSPNYLLVNAAFLDSLRATHIKVIPWTVNDKDAISKMLDLKVDGIITDYPERLLN
ncbi:glycerophosphoryl diester phosphodiesterase [Flavobacterium flevense]|uniref:Glycerophosphoryl diester phosphodiesterase n=1 Tax=Flavobacterium flevense TaxID=983 RepID=A0A4Y4AXP8_9FLAO|nr:glycerophosphodiester phosphodiesterase family protein [Flavobacterium flevense]GEC71374.1 glycerophosphoryl diester phosphodiesterase [Flavobacterium flevense]SHL80128.1 glycerophosphoryl diester phosphodiesterase [Flavobacterium flevense]